MILTKAAKVFGVSRTTMTNRIQNPSPNPVGRKLKFPPCEEERLADFLLSCSDQGVPLNRYHCLQLILEVAVQLELGNATFDDKFFRRFLDRHEERSMRITHCSNRKKDSEWTVERCEDYISKLQKLYTVGFLERLEQVWNLDKTAFDTSEMYDRVVARKGAKQIPSQFDETEKESVTIHPCGNAVEIQLKFMALYSGKVHVLSRLYDTHGLCYHAVNSSRYMDQVHFASYVKEEVFPAITELKVTKDNLLSHVVKLWYRTEGCVDKYAFNVAQCLKSEFAKTGLFPFFPDVIRKAVKAHHDPDAFTRGIRSRVEQDFGPLFQVLKSQFNLTTKKDLGDTKELIILKQKGITPGAVLANSVQKALFGEAPVEQRREKNKHLCLESGALTTQPSFVAELEKEEAEKATKKATTAAKRKTPTQEPAKGKSKANTVKKPRK
ncbi:hypothetical protein RvY_11309 [Ramazzottius varieornatus]|uniref:HTH psq-type domain-containing protein n=1 Tax=Ramazzottius varieornatus TaxID=947166 RepID=A0A1D1VI41_RAMVA|nr:hypothetical protein RvY_11309 [Ramazzottius varieornatus]